MYRNKQVRDRVIIDLEDHFRSFDGRVSFFSGRCEPVAASDDGGDLEVPAIAVYFSDGEVNGSCFDADEWESVLVVEAMALANNNLDDELDAIGKEVLKVLNREYSAGGLLILCNRKGFEYEVHDGVPWGSLLLFFDVKMEIDDDHFN